MSDGFNKEFMAGPVQFLSKDDVWDINSTGINGAGKANYILDEYQIGKFDLERYSDTTISLKNYIGGKTGHSIKAYYLNAKANTTQKISIGSDADYFFTDTIQGCTFAAYGNTRRDMIVEHINRLNDGQQAYTKEETAIRAMNVPVTIIYGAANYRVGGLRQLANGKFERGEDVVVTVFGMRKKDGNWHFYARRRLNAWKDQGGKRAIDANAFEIL
jgi:hypothetical protein